MINKMLSCRRREFLYAHHRHRLRRWGSLIAWYLDRTGHAVTLYGRPGSRHMQRFLATRRNDLLELPESIRLSTDLSCVRQAETVVISIGSQGLQGLMDQLRPLALGG